jgi:hypothetical protein
MRKQITITFHAEAPRKMSNLKIAYLLKERLFSIRDKVTINGVLTKVPPRSKMEIEAL